jgi:hypothetical protein
MQRARAYLVIAVLSLSAWIGCGSSEDPVIIVDPPEPTGPDTIAPAAITDIVSRSPGAGSIALQWIAPGDDEWTGTATSYDIRYSRSDINDGNWEQATPAPFPPIPVRGRKVQTHRVSGLDALTIYYFAIKTKDEKDNESELSKIAQGQTLQEYMPPSAITDLKADAVDDSTILLTWTAPGDDGVFGTATSYDIRWIQNTTVNATNWDQAERVLDPPSPRPGGEADSHFVTIPDPFGNYGFAVMSEDEAGNVSEISNRCGGLGLESYLWVFPQGLRKGNTLTILYRSDGVSYTYVGCTSPPVNYCGDGDVVLASDTFDAGTYETTFDFKIPGSEDYYDSGLYVVYICIDGELRRSRSVELLD